MKDREQLISMVTDIAYLVIGTLAMVASIAFSFNFFMYNNIHWFWSGVIAVIYVLFLNLIFEGAIALYIKSNKMVLEKRKQRDKDLRRRYTGQIILKRFQGSTILVVWLLLVFYSVISTVGGQYKSLSNANIDQRGGTTLSLNEVSDIEELIQLQKETKQSYLQEMVSINKRMDTVDTMFESSSFRTASKTNEKRIDELRLSIANINKTISNYKKEIIKIKDSSDNIVNGNTYKYFSRIIKVPGFIIQFALSFFPSIVLDFFAPISFAMVIFKRKK